MSFYDWGNKTKLKFFLKKLQLENRNMFIESTLWSDPVHIVNAIKLIVR